MLEELHASSSLLRAALERYINACFALPENSSYKNSINSSPELLDGVTNELDLVESYKTKLVQAQVAVKRARNNLANVPINSLPAEVLTHIFRLILVQQPCPLRVTSHWNPDRPVGFPEYPDILSHVCSRWRQITLASHALWSHIDLALSCDLSKGFHNRAVTYVARAHQSPLDIHLIDPGCIRQGYVDIVGQDSDDDEVDFDEWTDSVYENNPEEFTFLASSFRPQIRSLGLLVRYRYHPIHSRALEHCFSNCLPGGLSEFVIEVPGGALYGRSFFETNPGMQNLEDASGTQLVLSEQQLESALHPTTVLVLKNIYPRWTSAAYQGLTELRLLGKEEISSLDLIGVLKSSPGLRSIHCDFTFSDPLRSNTLSSPVILQDLEILDLRAMHKEGVEQFLRLLNPGPGRLRLLLRGNPTPTLLDSFFTRSNVQEMWVETKIPGFEEAELPPNKFCLPSGLRTLALTRWGWGLLLGRKLKAVRRSLSPCNDGPSSIKLDILYLLSCRYESFLEFHETVARFSPQRLVLWRCAILDYVDFMEAVPYIDLPMLQSELGDDLSQFCPSIECLTDQDPNPLQDWS